MQRFLAALLNRSFIFPFVVCKKDLVADGDTVDDRGPRKFIVMDREISRGARLPPNWIVIVEYSWNAIRGR